MVVHGTQAPGILCMTKVPCPSWHGWFGQPEAWVRAAQPGRRPYLRLSVLRMDDGWIAQYLTLYSERGGVVTLDTEDCSHQRRRRHAARRNGLRGCRCVGVYWGYARDHLHSVSACYGTAPTDDGGVVIRQYTVIMHTTPCRTAQAPVPGMAAPPPVPYCSAQPSCLLRAWPRQRQRQGIMPAGCGGSQRCAEDRSYLHATCRGVGVTTTVESGGSGGCGGQVRRAEGCVGGIQ